mmetsp:Transcript_8054/g.18833  ORF Transcript_8054/g.18833 Transcript_8054/m.18833 type:complete len:236 (+) Transcript_8054:510-1217(+)
MVNSLMMQAMILLGHFLGLLNYAICLMNAHHLPRQQTMLPCRARTCAVHQVHDVLQLLLIVSNILHCFRLHGVASSQVRDSLLLQLTQCLEGSSLSFLLGHDQHGRLAQFGKQLLRQCNCGSCGTVELGRCTAGIRFRLLGLCCRQCRVGNRLHRLLHLDQSRNLYLSLIQDTVMVEVHALELFRTSRQHLRIAWHAWCGRCMLQASRNCDPNKTTKAHLILVVSIPDGVASPAG